MEREVEEGADGNGSHELGCLVGKEPDFGQSVHKASVQYDATDPDDRIAERLDIEPAVGSNKTPTPVHEERNNTTAHRADAGSNDVVNADELDERDQHTKVDRRRYDGRDL